MKGNFSRQRFESADELFLAIEAFVGGPSADFFANRFSGIGTTITEML
jgi:hypothetical protein